MKKFLLITTTTLSLLSASIALAESPKSQSESFYIKGLVGASRFSSIESNNIELKSKTNALLGVGFGYAFADSIRTDITIDHHFNNEFNSEKFIARDGNFTYNGYIKSQPELTTVLLNGFLDFHSSALITMFIGGSIGMSTMKGKATYFYTKTDLFGQSSIGSNTTKIQKNNYFAYAFHLGISKKFTSNIYGELSYIYKDIGSEQKTVYRNGQIYSVKTEGLSSHNIVISTRFHF